MIHPVILIGGSGTRLWPLSRLDIPKQFLSLVTGSTMLEDTLGRVAGRQGFAPPLLVSGERHKAVLDALLENAAIRLATVLLEPAARNTAPAVAMAAHWIVRTYGDGLMLVLPSDHAIANVAAFHDRLVQARPAAEAGYLVTFGIKPDHPATGYGYIEAGPSLGDTQGVFHVTRFVEKPPLAVAERYLAEGRYNWNAGIFFFTARAFLRELERHMPTVAGPAALAMQQGSEVDGVIRPETSHFLACANESIDHAVMEKTDRAAVVPADIGWSDVGSWDALWSVYARDDQGNGIRGPVASVDSAGNLLLTVGGPPVAALGLTDMVVVSTAEAVLVMPRNRSQDVKSIMDMFDRQTALARSEANLQKGRGTFGLSALP